MSSVKISGLTTVLAGSALKDGLGFSSSLSSGFLGLYKGVKASALDLSGSVSAFRSTDRLWSAKTPIVSLGNSLWKVGENTSFSPEQEGVCTWFIYAGVDKTTNQIRAAIVGEVSDTVGKGDLILTKTNLILTEKYRISKLSIVFPYIFSY